MGATSLRGRVLWGCLATVAVCLVAVGLYLQDSFREAIIAQARKALGREMSLVREAVQEEKGMWGSPQDMDQLADRLGQGLQIRVTLIQPNGRVVGDSQVELPELETLEHHGDRPEVIQALARGEGWALRYSNTLGVDLLYVAYVLGTVESPLMVIRLAIPMEEVAQVMKNWRGALLMGGFLGVMLSLLVAQVLGSRVGRELEDLTREARGMARGEGASGPTPSKTTEVCALGRALRDLGSQMEQEMGRVEETRHRMETLLQSMVEGVLLTDRLGRILLANRALLNLMEPRVDPIGRTPAEAFRQAALQEAVERCLGEAQAQSLEMSITGPRPRVLEAHVAPVGKVGVVAVFHDITERKRLEELRRDLVASVSHELRTPLAAIRGSVETLLDGAVEDPTQGRRFLEIIQRHVLRLQRILEDLLDLSRLESQGTIGQRRPIRLVDLADAALDAISELASAKGVRLVREIPRPEVRLLGDQRHLEQALVNLLDNAIQYTDRGGRVTLRLEALDQEVHMVVEDTGIGIAPEHISRIFERFYRVDKARSREHGGTGLGLSIVKHIAQAHGGRVEVESTPGRGSTFRVVLPASG